MWMLRYTYSLSYERGDKVATLPSGKACYSFMGGQVASGRYIIPLHQILRCFSHLSIEFVRASLKKEHDYRYSASRMWMPRYTYSQHSERGGGIVASLILSSEKSIYLFMTLLETSKKY